MADTGQIHQTGGPYVVAVVLAAGGGSRFAGPTHKLDADLGGRPVVRWAVDSALESGIGPVVVVTSEHVTTPLAGPRPDGAPGGPFPEPGAEPPELHVVDNREWASGQHSSLRRGIETATRLGATRVVVGLGDQPFVTPAAWRAVAEAGATSPIAVATYRDGDGPDGGRVHRRGHPVSLDSSVWPLLPASGDEGARSLLLLRPDLVREVPCGGSAADIDTLEDLHRWQSSSSTSSP